MKTIAIYNNKGGVGKTTSVINIAYELSSLGKHVLIIDCDGQGNASQFFCNAYNGELPGGVEEVLTRSTLSPTSILQKTRYSRIDILPSSKAMNNTVQKFDALSDEQKMQNALKLKNEWIMSYTSVDYDYVIVDLPPALNSLTSQILSICDYVFVPIELGTFSIAGISAVTSIISTVGTKFGGCFVSKYDRKNPADAALMDMLHSSLGKKAMETYIPFSRVIKNSISYRLSAIEYMPWTEAAEKYALLIKEIISITGGA